MAEIIDVDVDGFGGVKNRGKEHDLVQPTVGQEQPGLLELREAQNFDLSNEKSLISRDGYELWVSLAGAHSIKRLGAKLVCGADSGLCLVDLAQKTSSVLNTAVEPGTPISWAQAGPGMYWTNGSQCGRIIGGANQVWGVDRPGAPTVSASAVGGMKAGKYQVTLTSLFGLEESGAGKGQEVAVAENGGITLTNIPSVGDYIRIYVTKQNGDVFFWHSDIPAGTLTYLIGDKVLKKPLATQFATRPPIGHIIAYNDGRIYIAKGNVLYYTMPQRYGLYRPSVDFLPPFNSTIKMIQPVDGGLYVDDGSLYFVRIDKIDGPQLQEPLPVEHSVKEGTNVSVPPYWFDLEGQELIGYWWTEQGFPVLGLPDGKVQAIGKDKIAIPKYTRGATLLRQKEGWNQLISAFNRSAPASNFACTDTLTATLITRTAE